MKPQDFPIHISAKEDEIAPLVVMPGDPKRAKYIAENFLEDAKMVSDVRGMSCFTGTYKGTRVSVMGHGMGMPSASIYLFELFYFYKVEKIIRVGTCGVISPEVLVPEIVAVDSIYSESNFAYQFDGSTQRVVYPSKSLLDDLLMTAKETNKKIHVGMGLTCDVFGPYVDIDAILGRIPKDMNPLVEEMEGFAICHVAKYFNKKAACIYTAVDSKFAEEVLTPEQRETSLNDMLILALDAIIK